MFSKNLKKALASCKETNEVLIEAVERLAKQRLVETRKLAETRALLRALVDASSKVLFSAGEHVKHTGDTLPHEAALAHLEDIANGAVELL